MTSDPAAFPPVRLTIEEIAAVKTCVARHFGERAVVRVFGSRTDLRRAGGDLDLHVTTGTEDWPSLAVVADFKEALVDRLGEIPVDLLVRPHGAPPRPIDHIAMNEGVVL